MLYGTEVHKALEEYVRDNKPLAKNYAQFKAVLDELLAIPGEKYPEHKMALTVKKEPCDFDSADRWVRGVVGDQCDTVQPPSPPPHRRRQGATT